MSDQPDLLPVQPDSLPPLQAARLRLERASAAMSEWEAANEELGVMMPSELRREVEAASSNLREVETATIATAQNALSAPLEAPPARFDAENHHRSAVSALPADWRARVDAAEAMPKADSEHSRGIAYGMRMCAGELELAINSARTA